MVGGSGDAPRFFSHSDGSGSPAANTRLVAGYLSSGQLRFSFFANNLDTTTLPATVDANWHHVVFVHDAVSLQRRIYYDGALVAEDASASAYLGGTQTLLIGQYSGNINADMDQLLLYHRVLQLAEVQDQYVNGNYELTGAEYALDSAVLGKDVSGHGRDLTVVGGVTQGSGTSGVGSCPATLLNLCVNVDCAPVALQTGKCVESSGAASCVYVWNRGAACSTNGGVLVASDGTCQPWSPVLAHITVNAGDQNGDKDDDIVILNPNRIYSYISDGAGGYANQVFVVPNGWLFGDGNSNWKWDSRRTFAADLNADGCLDFIRWGSNYPSVTYTYVHTFISKCTAEGGGDFFYPAFQADPAWDYTVLQNDGDTPATGLGAFDLFGRGYKSDLVRVDETTVYTMHPTGTNGTCWYTNTPGGSAACWTTHTFAGPWTFASNAWIDENTLVRGDFEGSGYDSFGRVDVSTGVLYIYVSKGDGQFWTPKINLLNHLTLAQGGVSYDSTWDILSKLGFDVDSDGQDDIVFNRGLDAQTLYFRRPQDPACFHLSNAFMPSDCVEVTFYDYFGDWWFSTANSPGVGGWGMEYPQNMIGRFNGSWSYARPSSTYIHFFTKDSVPSSSWDYSVWHNSYAGSPAPPTFDHDQTTLTYVIEVGDWNNDGIDDHSRVSTTAVHSFTGSNACGSQAAISTCMTYAAHTAPLTVGYADTQAPSAALSGSLPNVDGTGGTSYSVAIQFTDDAGINAASIAASNLVITIPAAAGGGSMIPSSFSIDIPSDGTPRTVTYILTPPGGTWDASDDGVYTVSLATNQVSDIGGNFVPGFTVGTFTVAGDDISPTASSVSISPALVRVGDSITLTFTSSETLTSATVTFFTGATTPRPVTATEGAANAWTATYTVQATDPIGPVTFEISMVDGASNTATKTTTDDASSTINDDTPPTVTGATMSSSNLDDSAIAVAGDTVTLLLTTDEDIQSPVVTFLGGTRTGTVVDDLDGDAKTWTVTYTIVAGDAVGPLSFSVVATDINGNEAAAHTTLTGGSAVQVQCGGDAYGATCTCNIDVKNVVTEYPLDLIIYTATNTPPVYSQLKNNVLQIVYTESIHYTLVSRSFGGVDGQCSDKWNWASSDDEAACQRTWTGTMTWTDWASCLIDEDTTTSTTDIIYSVNFGVQNKERTSEDIRGAPVYRTVVQYLPFTIEFPKSIDVSVFNIQVFSEVVELGAIVTQNVVGTPGSSIALDLEFATSVQWPFKLSTPTWMSGDITAPIDKSPLPTLSQSLECGDSVAGSTPNCFDKWTVTVEPDPAADPAVCELDGDFTVHWVVECQPSVVLAGDCPIGSAVETASITFTVDTSYFCVKLVDEINLSASLVTYEDSGFVKTKDDFLDGQTVYAQVPTTSSKVSLKQARVVAAAIDRTAPLVDVTLIDGATLNSAYGVARVDHTTPVAAPGDDVTPSFSFVVNTDAAHLNLAADSRETMTLTATVQVVYENAGQAPLGLRTINLVSRLQSKSQEAEASRAVGMNGRSASGGGDSDTSSSILGMSSATAMYAGAGLVVVALVGVLVVMMVKGKRKRSDKQTAMTKSSSSTQMVELATETEAMNTNTSEGNWRATSEDAVDQDELAEV